MLIAIDTNAVLHHVDFLIQIKHEFPASKFSVSSVVLGELLRKSDEEFTNFIQKIGEDSWVLGPDWVAALKMQRTKPRIDKKYFGMGKAKWNQRTRLKVKCLVREIIKFRKYYDLFYEKKLASLRKKFEKIRLARGCSAKVPWFKSVFESDQPWDPNSKDALWALELKFPNTFFSTSNPTVVLSAFLFGMRLAGILVSPSDYREAHIGNVKMHPMAGFLGTKKDGVSFFDLRVACEAVGCGVFLTGDDHLLKALSAARDNNLVPYKFFDIRQRNLEELRPGH